MDTALSIWPAVLAKLLPQDCFLCGAAAGDALLCGPCATTLPRLPEGRCPVCAESAGGGTVCGACQGHPPAFAATVAAFRYTHPVDKLVQALKYRHRLAIADHFAAAMLVGPTPPGDLLVPVPLSTVRLRERGFNQALEIARRLAHGSGLPLELAGVSRQRDTLPQAMLPWKERRRNIHNAFACTADLAGREVIVVDDVMTSGATLAELAATLKAAGAARVRNWVAARALRS
jgi:ComF family protein